MINLSNAILTNCIVHQVGNKTMDGDLVLSKKEVALDEELESQLNLYFLRQFKSVNESYQFHHDIDLNMNEVFVSADNLFEDESFLTNSKNIANHLFQQTRNPAIKSGELFIALFEELIFENTICKAVGIFKSERKDNFFKIDELDKNFQIQIDNGISQQKLDKGCLILNDAFHEGFRVFTYEHNNADTDYWRNDFLGIKQREDNYFQTKKFLSVCKDFVQEQLPDDFEVTKADQIDLLNKSVDYFKNNKNFKVNEFVKDVFEDPGIIKSFKKYKTEYQENENVQIDDAFDISSQAVKKQVKNFKSVLKLDKNFHVYIHGDRDKIQQGVEKDGRKYYKIYFEEEM